MKIEPTALQIGVSIFLSGTASVVFLYNNFETKAESDGKYLETTKRLDHIDAKLDTLLLNWSNYKFTQNEGRKGQIEATEKKVNIIESDHARVVAKKD